MLDIILNICKTNEKFMLCVAILVIIDTVLGITKAIKNDEFSFTSNGLRKCLPKLIEYISIIILGIAIEFTFSIKCVLILCIFIIVTELVSIKENLSAIPAVTKFLDSIISSVTRQYSIDDSVIGDEVTETNDTVETDIE